VLTIRQLVTFATAGLCRDIDGEDSGQMSERRSPIRPVDVLVVGLLEHDRHEGEFTPLIGVRGKTLAAQDVAQVNQPGMPRHGQGITGR
jgi:hypothetical protein